MRKNNATIFLLATTIFLLPSSSWAMMRKEEEKGKYISPQTPESRDEACDRKFYSPVQSPNLFPSKDKNTLEWVDISPEFKPHAVISACYHAGEFLGAYSDRRKRVFRPNAFPYSMHALVFVENKGRNTRGSATLIGPNTFVTAAHLVSNSRGELASSLTIAFGVQTKRIARCFGWRTTYSAEIELIVPNPQIKIHPDYAARRAVSSPRCSVQGELRSFEGEELPNALSNSAVVRELSLLVS